MCTRSGTGCLPRERARERRGLVPHELVQRSCLVRPTSMRASRGSRRGRSSTRVSSTRRSATRSSSNRTGRWSTSSPSSTTRTRRRGVAASSASSARPTRARPGRGRSTSAAWGRLELRPGDGRSSPNSDIISEIAVDLVSDARAWPALRGLAGRALNGGRADAVAFRSRSTAASPGLRRSRSTRRRPGFDLNQQAFTPSVDVGADGTVAVATTTSAPIRLIRRS